MVVSEQPFTIGALSPTKATVGFPQLSASSITKSIFGAGNVPLHRVKVMAIGLEAVGKVVSMVLIKF
jgi:hypothetical protein